MRGSAYIQEDVRRQIADKLGQAFHLSTVLPATGGDINQAFHITADGQHWFLKVNTQSYFRAFECEFNALETIASCSSLRVPRPYIHGKTANQSFLLMEHLELSSSVLNSASLGKELACLHKNTSDTFGWTEDNFIGRTPQPNTRCSDWIEFWQRNRLGFQLNLAKRNSFPKKTATLLEKLNERICDLFSEYKPEPSLLHGDLWAGNKGYLQDGTAVIFDPASYYGDRETDIAMTELFGGFDAEFYEAYNAEWPLDAGYSLRRPLYQLYHILNHFNLFGGHYAAQAHSLADSLVREIQQAEK